MPRKPRIISSNGIYHITLRSINQHIIFEETSDYQKFLFILSDCKKEYDIDIYAYCLMDNHVHLLLFSSPDQLPSFFQSLGTRFARWYNNKNSRTGHLFQERYHSQPIDSEGYFLSALVYIHNNPVNANMCKDPSEYRWSSFNAYYGAKDPLIKVEQAYAIAGSKAALQNYFATVDDSLGNDLFFDIHQNTNHFLTDEMALDIFKSVTKMNSISDTAKLNRIERNAYIQTLRQKRLTAKQVARVMDVSLSTVKRICKTDL